MTEPEDTTEDSASNLPEEPEQMRLWRELIEIRDHLVESIPRYESSDHPARQHLRHIEAVTGKPHGYGDGYLRQIDEAAARTARDLRERLKRLDKRVSVGAREDTNDRGTSMVELRELVAYQAAEVVAHVAPAERTARAALEAWLSDSENVGKRHAAQLAIWRMQNRSNSTPSDFTVLPDLNALRETDRAHCRETSKQRNKPKGTTEAVAARIMRRLRGERVT